METKKELEGKILNVITKIQDKFPELSKYITEMPLDDSNNEEVIIKNLQNYYRSLEEIVAKYAQTHPDGTTKTEL